MTDLYSFKYAPGVWRLTPGTRVEFMPDTEPRNKGYRYGTVVSVGTKYVHFETDADHPACSARKVRMPIANHNGFDAKVPGIRRLK